MIAPVLSTAGLYRIRISGQNGRYSRFKTTLLLAIVLLGTISEGKPGTQTPAVPYQISLSQGGNRGLSFRAVPPSGFRTAVAITVQRQGLHSQPLDPAQIRPSISWSRTVFHILPRPENTGPVTWEAPLPPNLAPVRALLRQIEIRLVMQEIKTGRIFLTTPLKIPLPGGGAGTASAGQKGAPKSNGANAAQNNDDEGETWASTAGGNSPGSPKGSAQISSRLSLNFGTLSLQSVAGSALVTIHDQPTPVQGSGH